MADFSIIDLSRRESQIMEIVYRRGRATAAEVQEELADAPGYSSVRKLLQVLEEKGHLRHEEEGRRYVFLPIVPRESARRSVLRQVVDTFFGGSIERAVSSLLEEDATEMTDEELARIVRLARRARREGR
jgi:predicted transcriptional regulator